MVLQNLRILSIVNIFLEGIKTLHAVWLAKKLGDHVEIVVVNPTAKPVEQVRVALAEHAITSAISRFDNDRQPTLTDGAIIDRLPAYGVAVYQVKN